MIPNARLSYRYNQFIPVVQFDFREISKCRKVATVLRMKGNPYAELDAGYLI